MNKASKQFRSVCICLLLALATLAAYWQLHSYEFISYDDGQYVTENRHVKAGLTRDGVIWAFSSGHASNWHPVTWLSHMLDCQLFGTDAGWHHLTNLLLHIINTLLLFAVLKQMTGAIWASGFVAACFALHPLHVESVAWIAERKDVLSTMFWMLTLLAYGHYVKRPAIGRYIIIMLTLALGLMAKPMLVTLPFVLLLLDYWPLGRLRFAAEEGIGRWRSLRGLIIEKIPLFALSVVSSVVTFLVQRSGGAVKRVDTFPLITRLSNALVGYASYIGKMFWPSRLAVFYPHPGGNLPAWQVAAAAVFLLIITVCVIRLATRYRYLPVGWFWYIGTLIPVIGLVQVGDQAIADRYTYIPLTGLFVIIAWALPELISKRQFRRVVLAISSGLILLGLLICTRTQVKLWQNSLTLFSHALEVTENNDVIHNNLGTVLQFEGKLDEAISHYRQALQITPYHAEAHNNLGSVLLARNKSDEAISHFRQALQAKPDYAEAYSNLGYALARQGRFDEAVRCYEEALKINPNLAGTHSNLGQALTRQGKLDEAIHQYTKALQINSGSADTHNDIAVVLAKLDRFDEAAEHFNEALRIRPDFAEARKNLDAIITQQNKP